MNSIARGMFKRALTASAVQLGARNSQHALEMLRRGDCNRCDTLRYNLARQIAGYFAQLATDMRAIYLYDPEYASGNYESPRTGASSSAAINLVVWARAKKSMPQEAIRALGDAFDKVRAAIVCPEATGQCFRLNVAVVNDADVKTRRGYAAMIDSRSVRPTPVWMKKRAARAQPHRVSAPRKRAFPRSWE
jgi:hypothetical protein